MPGRDLAQKSTRKTEMTVRRVSEEKRVPLKMALDSETMPPHHRNWSCDGDRSVSDICFMQLKKENHRRPVGPAYQEKERRKMPTAVPLKKRSEPSVRPELTAEDLVARTRKILEIKEKVMRENVHYGVIPGCRKPSLWKPGAEILCQGFRLAPEFVTTSSQDLNHTIKWEKWDYDHREKVEGLTKGYFEYDTQCTLAHIPTGEVWARAVSGSCNNFEAKYRSLNPYDIKNTLEKMSEKRALVAAVLIGVGLRTSSPRTSRTYRNSAKRGLRQKMQGGKRRQKPGIMANLVGLPPQNR